MDPDSLAEFTNKRRNKYQPKAPPRREQQPLVCVKDVKVEDVYPENEQDQEQKQKLLGRLEERKGHVKNESNALPSVVSFGLTSSLKSFKTYKGNNTGNSFLNGDGIDQKIEKDYKEPWDYATNYPITLPLRRPYSGNPEVLDQQEFGQASENVKYDENAINSGIDLGLMEENAEPDLLFFQLPANMPLFKPPSAIPKESTKEGTKEGTKKGTKEGDDEIPDIVRTRPRASSINDLSLGHMGKLLVYNSGIVKLKLGDQLYDVSAGMRSLMAQDVVAVNTEAKHCAVVGGLNKRVVVTPDVDSMLETILLND